MLYLLNDSAINNLALSYYSPGIIWNIFHITIWKITEAYLGPCQRSLVEHFCHGYDSSQMFDRGLNDHFWI